MPFQIDRPDEPVADALRRIARKELSSAAAAARAAEGGGTANVHAMRKSIKKTRAILRLLRGRMAGAADVNETLRDIGRAISASRDAQVLPATATTLATTADVPTAALLGRAAARLAQAATTTADPAAVAGAGRLLASAADAVRGWRIDGKGFDALSDGLERTLSRVRDAAARAAHPTGDPTADAEAIHDWRKRVKDHWYHARLLTPIWPDLMAPHAAAVGKVGEDLGLHQDIHVLLARLPDAGLTRGEAAAVRTHALTEAARIRIGAEALAARAFADRPAALVNRWHVWWRLWRNGADRPAAPAALSPPVRPPVPSRSAPRSYQPRKAR
jgi:CHAD domain-containing protein